MALAKNFTSVGAGALDYDKDLDLTMVTVISVLIVVLAVGGNGLQIVVASKFPRMRSLSDLFVVSKASSHLLLAAVVMPFSLYDFLMVGTWTLGPVTCVIWLTSLAVSVQVCAFSLCFIILDTYFEIVHRTWYKDWLDVRKVAFALFVTWGFPLVTNMWPLVLGKWPELFLTDNNRCHFRPILWLVYTAASLDFLLPGFFVVGLYACAFYYCKKTLDARRTTRVDYADFSRIFDPSERRTLIIVGVEVVSHVVLWAPFWIMVSYFAHTGRISYEKRKVISWLCYLTTVVNPALHVLGNWKFRFLLGKLCRRRRFSSITSRLDSPTSLDRKDDVSNLALLDRAGQSLTVCKPSRASVTPILSEPASSNALHVTL